MRKRGVPTPCWVHQPPLYKLGSCVEVYCGPLFILIHMQVFTTRSITEPEFLKQVSWKAMIASWQRLAGTCTPKGGRFILPEVEVDLIHLFVYPMWNGPYHCQFWALLGNNTSFWFLNLHINSKTKQAMVTHICYSHWWRNVQVGMINHYHLSTKLYWKNIIVCCLWHCYSCYSPIMAITIQTHEYDFVLYNMVVLAP